MIRSYGSKMTRARMTAFGAGLQRLAVPVSVLSHVSGNHNTLSHESWRCVKIRTTAWYDTVTVYKSFRLERERVYKSWFKSRKFWLLMSPCFVGELQVINFVDVVVATFQVSTVYIRFHTGTCRSVAGSTSMLETVPMFIALLFWWHAIMVHAYLWWPDFAEQRPQVFTCRSQSGHVE